MATSLIELLVVLFLWVLVYRGLQTLQRFLENQIRAWLGLSKKPPQQIIDVTPQDFRGK
jgi:hypothetical protein